MHTSESELYVRLHPARPWARRCSSVSGSTGETAARHGVDAVSNLAIPLSTLMYYRTALIPLTFNAC